MAAVYIEPLYIDKGRTIAGTLTHRTNYSMNPEKTVDKTAQQAITDALLGTTNYSQNADKTQGGELVKGYECDPRTVVEEFMLTKKQYAYKTGRNQGKKNVIASEQKAIEVLESSVTKIFTSFASGKISQDIFLQKKDSINDTIERKRSEIKKREEQLHNLIESRNRTENTISELKQFQDLEKLNKDIVDLLIDKILVHDEKDIEIVWRGVFGDGEVGV